MTTNGQERIFLSASIPLPSRNPQYFATADVIAIRDAVRALIIVTLESDYQLVFGGHPAITPMIRMQLTQSAASGANRVVLYQSRYFASSFPPDNSAFTQVCLIDEVPNDRTASLSRMREEMLRGSFRAGLFIGGMEGVEDEYALFTRLHPGVPAYPIASTGAAAARIYSQDGRLQQVHPELQNELSYLSLMRVLLRQSRHRGTPRAP